MKKTEKIKRLGMIIVMASLSGYFMYQGFSIILYESETNTTTQKEMK